ncbi:MAG: DNA topoisomerase [Eubacteriales bacterium]
MSKILIITEKPSVAREFAKALSQSFRNKDGYLESDETIVTWCVGHLVTMSYPDAYDPMYKKWTMETIPFIPEEYRYEILDRVKKQFNIVKELFHRDELTAIYNAGDSGREGEYIQRLVLQEAGYKEGIALKRIWIDSQTEDEILRGIQNAKDMTEYDNLSASAYLRAKEDYLMGINFSRVLSLKYSQSIKNYLQLSHVVIAVGRVMTCVLGMIVKREREFREFVKTPFYRVNGTFQLQEQSFEGEWKALEGSKYFQSPLLYKENGFLKRESAQELCQIIETKSKPPIVEKIEKKKETKNPPLLYNLAELQNDCSKLFKISPDETLKNIQELYEKKLVTYPRTDARVLSTAVAKEISKNIQGLQQFQETSAYAKQILDEKTFGKIAKSRYVNDKQITDHYAIIPTGQGMNNLRSLTPTQLHIYELISKRFLAIFYPPAIYQKVQLTIGIEHQSEETKEFFVTSNKVLVQEGYLAITKLSFIKKKEKAKEDENEGEKDSENEKHNPQLTALLTSMKKGMVLEGTDYTIKEGETSPPKRYNSGTIILAMENAGQLIEDDELRAQIKGSGIGTSATRAEILKKLSTNQYISLHKKTQVITPTLMGEMIYDVVDQSIKPLLDPSFTASWEKGLTLVANGSVTSEEYIEKLNGFVIRRIQYVKSLCNQSSMQQFYQQVATHYKTTK